LLLVKAEHAAATERLRLLEALVAGDAKGAAKAAAKEEKKAAAAAAAEAGEPVVKKPRGVWPSFVYGDPSPPDGGEPILPAKERFPDEYAAFVATLPNKRGADINFASEASTASEGDPVGIPKPVAEEGESDDDYAARVEEWRTTDGVTLWSVDAHEVYAEHTARFKAIAEARSADGSGSSSKKKRVKLTEEQKLANRAARAAATKAKNEALKVAKAAEKAAKAKPAKAKAPPTVVKNAAKPPVKAAGGAGRPPVVSLTAASDDSDSSSDEEKAPPPKGKPGPPAPKAGAAPRHAPPPPKAKKEPPAAALEEAAAAASASEEEGGDV
jgi:hypothetical protein